MSSWFRNLWMEVRVFDNGKAPELQTYAGSSLPIVWNIREIEPGVAELVVRFDLEQRVGANATNFPIPRGATP